MHATLMHNWTQLKECKKHQKKLHIKQCNPHELLRVKLCMFTIMNNIIQCSTERF